MFSRLATKKSLLTGRLAGIRRAGRVSVALLAVLSCLASADSILGQTSAEPLRTIIPVSFDVSTGDITVGNTFLKGSNPGFHIVAFGRRPKPGSLDRPDFFWDASYTDAPSAFRALQVIKNASPDAMILVNAVGNYGFTLADKAGVVANVPTSIGGYLREFGAYPDLDAINATIRLVFIGKGGAKPETALQRGGDSTRPVSGYLAPDSSGNYAFIQTDFLRYDIQLNGDITIGKKTYTVANSNRCSPAQSGCSVSCNGQNAFHLVVVDREDPTFTYADNTYCTAASNAEIQRLGVDLSVLTGNQTNEGRLVFLGSSGKPIPRDWDFGTNGDARIVPLARQVRQLGGYWETMVYLKPNDTYSLVGAAPPRPGTKNARARARESSSVYPEISAGVRPSGELHGVLARRGFNLYSPLNADTGGYANLGLYEILALNPAPFPHPTGPAELAAYQYINSKLCNGCNIRELYDDLNVVIGTYQNTLQAMQDSNGRSCDVAASNADATFCTVRRHMLTELAYVANIRAFFQNLQQLWLGQGSITILSQLNAYNEIKAQLPAPAQAPSRSLAQKMADMFLQLGARVPTIGPVFGAADVIFNFLTDLTMDQQGNKTIDLTATIGTLQQQAIDQFSAQQTTTGTLFKLIYQDWAKLSALGSALASQGDRNSPWYWDLNATGLMLNQLTPAIRQASYESLMSASYAIGSYMPNASTVPGYQWGRHPLWGQPYAYVVEDFRSAPSPPQSHPFWLDAYVPYTYPGDPDNPYADDPRTSTLMTDDAWLGISALNTAMNGTSDDFKYVPPSEQLRTLLFNPVWKNGLGVYRPAFFNDWPFPRVACDPALGNYTGSHQWVGGCAWSAAAPAPEQVVGGRSITDLTIRAVVSSREKPRPQQMNVMLIIHNNGTLPANSVTINSIALRTLTGVGQATLANPALPIRLNNLQPGDSTSVILGINVPSGVFRLSLTQQGTITSGNAEQPTELRFSEAQALVLP